MLMVRYFTKGAQEQFRIQNLFLVVQFGWIDHEPPPFELLQRLIDDMFNYLSQYPNNGIAIHCKVDLLIQ